MLSKQQFTNQLFDLRDQYRTDNAWVGKWDESWNDEDVMTKFITCAYNLYAATARNALKLTVLGGTEIRTDETYVRNFGVTSANGIQEEDTRTIVHAEQIRRRMRKRFPHQAARNPDLSYTRVTGSGSILSEKGWTPILNDSLILGAINAGQVFKLGLTPAEQVDWKVMNEKKQEKAAQSKTAFLAGKFGGTQAMNNAWKAFFNSQKRMFFFDWGGPRVFTRELLGLHFFGYKPEFSWHQLGFYASDKRPPSDFRTYLQKLREVGFHAPTNHNQAKIIETISEFLFNDSKALGSPWPPTTKTKV